MANYQKKELIVIAGPTAVGKTSYAIELNYDQNSLNTVEKTCTCNQLTCSE